ncbi:MAG: hypothetical protein IPL32_15385 [Chloracidobacterium sp.]|nr:hypothetical protein [Chloracidobacterium sp.]
MNAHDKARLLGLFFWLFTAFNVLVVGIIAIIYIALFGFIFTATPQKAGDPPPELIMGIIMAVFIFVLIFTVLFSVPKVVAGYGLRKNKPWARTWTIIASIMCCLSFPFGTAIGVFGLIFLFSDDGKRYFEDAAYRDQLAGSNVAPLPPNSWQ